MIILAGIAIHSAIKYISENADSDIMESGEVHVTKTLPPASDKEMWIFGARDFTVYGKYYYENGIPEETLDNHELFSKVTEDDIYPIQRIIYNYEGWVEATKGNGAIH